MSYVSCELSVMQKSLILQGCNKVSLLMRSCRALYLSLPSAKCQVPSAKCQVSGMTNTSVHGMGSIR
ncbi:hypothetical protein [Vibrio coralliirubri]|uniref:hypothetical protein n=1 Tax=Vibrio coralliirubri TaxID=1516159 RepID=UPI0012E0543E|nr:hypothetical protein [Vibrio coralliirubri]